DVAASSERRRLRSSGGSRQTRDRGGAVEQTGALFAGDGADAARPAWRREAGVRRVLTPSGRRHCPGRARDDDPRISTCAGTGSRQCRPAEAARRSGGAAPEMNVMTRAFLAVLVATGVLQTLPSVRFDDITTMAGIEFRHTNGASPQRHLQEIMGSGGLFFD